MAPRRRASEEYVSVSSQSDTEKADMARERRELAEQTDAELRLTDATTRPPVAAKAHALPPITAVLRRVLRDRARGMAQR